MVFCCLNREAIQDVIANAEKKIASDAILNPGKSNINDSMAENVEKNMTGDEIVKKIVDDIELINADSQAPDTYKIVCNDDIESQDAVYEIFQLAEPNPLKVEELATIPEVMEDESFSFMDDETLQTRVAELLKIVVDEDVLSKLGYPDAAIDSVLSSVLLECEQKPVDFSSCPNIGTKIRENVKQLFTTVIGDDSIKEMLNNRTVDEVINHVITLAQT